MLQSEKILFNWAHKQTEYFGFLWALLFVCNEKKKDKE